MKNGMPKSRLPQYLVRLAAVQVRLLRIHQVLGVREHQVQAAQVEVCVAYALEQEHAKLVLEGGTITILSTSQKPFCARTVRAIIMANALHVEVQEKSNL